MSQISLKEFTGQIRQRIDEERASEAIPMAQYLLRQYPRYLKGYELLAEAALQQGNIKDAIEVFRRVLSADPENLIAYRGMAAAYAEEEEISEALWYMMRAFERDPRVRGVRQELRQLYQQRDGRRPGRLNLNRAALARMYMREGLYNRAIEELSIELESGPHGPASDRVDLFIALAEAQWVANLRSDAVRTAQKVRLELPYCLKANLILAEFYAQQDDLASADIHLRIAEQMDPENDLAVELFGESGYLQPNQIMIESLEEAWKTAQPGSDEEHKMPEWLADLSLFATAEPQDQEVDWDAIIAYETDWRTILAKTTHEAITNFVPNWRVDLRNATRLSLSERQDEQAESAILDVPEQRLPLILEPTEQALPPILDLEKGLYSPTVEAEEEPSARLEAKEDLPSARVAKEESSHTLSEPPSTLLPDVVPPQLVTPDWREALQEATSEALKDATPAQAKQEAPSKGLREEELALGSAWKEELRAETEPWLDKIEAQGESEAIKPPEPFIIEPAPIIEPERSWISSLTAATRAELEAVEQAREAPESLPEVIEPAESSWVKALRQESQELTPAQAPESLPEPVEPAKAAWVKALRQESDELTPALAPESLPEPIQPAKAPWVEALRQESDELLTPAFAPESLPEVVEPTKAAWVQPLRDESQELAAMRLTEELTEEAKASTPLSPAALGAEREALLAKGQEAIIPTEKQEADREDKLPPPIELVPELPAREPEEKAPIETTVIPLAAEAAWTSALREETQEQLEVLSIATSPWAIALRGATEEQLEKLSVADTAWATALRDDSQRQLDAISAGTTAWATALRRDTALQLESLSAAESAWVKGLRHQTEQQLLTLSSNGSPWAKNLHQETKNLLRWMDEGNKGWISALQDDSHDALNAYQEAHRPPQVPKEVVRERPSRKEEVSRQKPDIIAPVARRQEPDIIPPVERRQEPDIIAPVARRQAPDIIPPVERREPDITAPVERPQAPDIIPPVEPRQEPAIIAPVARRQEPDIIAPVERRQEPDIIAPVERPQAPDIIPPVEPRQEPAIIAPVERRQEPAITTPVEPPQSDFIASLMAAAEKVAGDEEQLSEVAEDFWDEIEVQESESLPELSLGSAEERVINEPIAPLIAPPIAPPIKEVPKAREERLTQPPSRSERVPKKEVVRQKEAVKAPARPTPAKVPPIKERKAAKVPVVEEKTSAVSEPSDEWQTARWLWESKQDKEALAIYQRIFDEQKAPNEKLEEELSAWTKTGKASALAYQLLGDLYRRMGRMQDAVVQYREAINRM